MAAEQVPVMGRLGRFYVLGEGKCNYEKEVYASGVNREIHYLYGGNGLAAIYVKTAGKDTLFAAVTDRQNSLTAVMDAATGKIEKFSYKPWGMRRNPANWSENVVTDYPARFSRGYCMHEHLPQFGLINMGGRIFDERTNQFLSPDPYRQAPESWLNCNRFGYCMGNPVMYTDPEGEETYGYGVGSSYSYSPYGQNNSTSLFGGQNNNNWDYSPMVNVGQNNNGTSGQTLFQYSGMYQYGTSDIQNRDYDYTSLYASNNPVNNMSSFSQVQQSLDQMYAQVQQGIQNAIACANATAANAQTVSVSLGQSGSGVNPLTITGMPSNTGAGLSSPTYDQKFGFVVMGFGNAYPFSDSYNSSTAEHVFGCVDLSWFPTGYSSTSRILTPTTRFMNFLNCWELGSGTVKRFVDIHEMLSGTGGTTNPGTTVNAPRTKLVSTQYLIPENNSFRIQSGGVIIYTAFDTMNIYEKGNNGRQYDTIIHPAR